jgi:hypothetical protein
MRFLFIISLFLISFGAFSQANLMEMNANTKKSDNFLDNFSGFVTLSGSTDLKETTDETKAYSTQFSAIVNYVINQKNTLRFDIMANKDLTNNFEESINDGRISHTLNGIFRSKILTTHYRTSLRIPVSERSIKRDRVNTAVELNLVNIINLNSYVKGLSIVYIPRYRRFFNEFETDINGDNLVEQNLINIIVMAYQLTDKIALSSTFVYVNSRGYNGTDRPASYGTTQDITYTLGKSTSASFGIQTGGEIRNFERGTDTSIEIIDENTTSVYTGLNLVF